MGTDLKPFADNWAYLKTELAWLDRLLMLAISRQRKDTQAIKKVAKTPADRLSNHWWKGVISVPKPAYDDCRAPAPKKASCAAIGYQAQLERRIQLSAQEDVVLALPSLRHYLNLTLFEKNLLLMVLAPEVNRRYGKLYHFLQTGEESQTPSGLPMVDLALRLLCRNDLERRRARTYLTGPHSLIKKGVLRFVSTQPGPLINRYLQLSEEWTDYFLAEAPQQDELFARLASPPLALPEPTAASRAITLHQPTVTWDQLMLPTPLFSQLQTLSQRASADMLTRAAGQLVLLVGDRGTGKTTAAGAIASSMRQPLTVINLQTIDPQDASEILTTLTPARYPVVLVKSASRWFGRQADEAGAFALQRWIEQRRSAPGLTLLSTRYLHMVTASWRQQMAHTFTFPIPNRSARKMLWRQAFSGIVCSPKLDWMALAAQERLSGGEIHKLAADAIAIAQSKQAKTITWGHIQHAISQRKK